MKLETRNQKQKSRRREQFILYAPLFFWIGVIFFLSTSQGSMGQTSRIIRPLLEFLFPGAPPETIIFYHGVIRKFAHFTEYAVLGLLACRAFSVTDVIRRLPYLLSIALVVLVAVIDETLQSYNPARTGSPIDVGIDITGGLFAVAFYYLVVRRWQRRKLNRPAPRPSK